MKTKDRAQLDLFAPPPAPTPEVTAPREWREVKAEVFLSWTEELQLRYCAKRDFDSAVEAEEDGNTVWEEWYQARGEAYLAEAERLKTIRAHPDGG